MPPPPIKKHLPSLRRVNHDTIINQKPSVPTVQNPKQKIANSFDNGVIYITNKFLLFMFHTLVLTASGCYGSN